MVNNSKKTTNWISVSIILIASMMLNSCQNFGDADKKYDRLEYAKAIPIYKKALKKDSKNSTYWAKLGDCYRKNNQVKEAEDCYANAVSGDSSKSIYKFEYARTLMSNEKYSEALEWMEKYLKEEPDDSWAKELASGLSHLDNFFINKDKFSVQNLSINSSESEFGSAFYKDGIIFTSCRNAKIDTKDNEGTEYNSDQWTGKGFYSLFYAKGSKNNFEQPVVFLNGIQSKYHNTSACFNNDATELFITRTLIHKKDSEKKLPLQIYSSTLENNKWESVVSFPYNSDNYSCAHPALSRDGKKLYFSSDMPGSIGGMDLWVSKRSNTGWEAPVNLGPKINTKGNDVFPTIGEDGSLYFSSDGHEGIGGLDLYCSKDTLNSFAEPVNLGAPFNSSDDDFSLIFDTKNDFGYLSSNRTKKGNNDDIFYIEKIHENLTASINANNKLIPGNIAGNTDNIVQPDAAAQNVNSTGTNLANSDNESLSNSSTENTNVGSPSSDDNSNMEATADAQNKKTSGLINSNINGNRNNKISSSQAINSNTTDPALTGKSNSNSTGQKMNKYGTPRKNTNSALANNSNTLSDSQLNNDLSDPSKYDLAIFGKLTHQVTGSPLENSAVKLVNLSNLDTLIAFSGKDGIYSFSGLTVDRRYRLLTGVEYCNVQSVDTEITNSNRVVRVNMALTCSEENMSLSNIYYDFNKSNIRPDAAKELDKLVKIMKQNTQLDLVVSAFTDCRGTDAYNMALSQRRAASVVAYLESRGIDHRRLVAVGYGETRPVNKCDCGNNPNASCTEDDYQRNRRAEFRLKSRNLPA